MDLLIFMALLLGVLIVKNREQHQRIQLLGRHLARYDIEKVMEGLTEGYLRALGEANPQRQAQVWSFLATQEEKLCAQFQSFVAELVREAELPTRVSTLAVALPFAARLIPAATFDLRQALRVHAQGIADAVENRDGLSQKDKAYTLCAELFLMQHTCHWFCRSKSVASARLLGRHKTAYAQVLGAVSPRTRHAYEAVLRRRS